MKYIYKIVVASFFVATIISCNDDDAFIDQKSPDELTSNLFWRNAEDAQSGLTAAYSELEGRSDFWNGWQEGRPIVEYFRSDYALPGPDAINYAHWMEFFNFNYTNGHNFLNVLWKTNYKGLNFSNQVITKVGLMTSEQISADEKKQIIGEATFLRGYYHFKLLTLFEKIVLRTELISQGTLNKALSTRKEAWEVILKDFQDAEKLLNVVGNTQAGRATKGAALAYLGKAYMYKAGDATSSDATDFQNAVASFKKVVEGNAGTYSLEPNFLSLFNGENENNQESIFELQFKTSDGTSSQSTILHAFIADPAIGGWGGLEANPAVVTEMKTEGMIATTGRYDSRLYNSVYFRDPFFNDINTKQMQGSTWDKNIISTYGDEKPKGSGIYFANTVTAEKNSHAYFRKWLPNYVRDNGSTGLNVVVMRYADVLLMYAEALNETGATAEAITHINKIRAIHGNMPAITAISKDAVKTQIIHERTMELTLESVRFFDLRRWGMLDQAMQNAGRAGFSTAKHAYLPVPLAEIQANSEIN